MIGIHSISPQLNQSTNNIPPFSNRRNFSFNIFICLLSVFKNYKNTATLNKLADAKALSTVTL